MRVLFKVLAGLPLGIDANTRSSTSQFRVEEKLDQYLRDLRSGRCEGSVVSYQTVESLTADDKALWRDTRKELNEIGISVSAFEQNKQYIFQWLAHAMETGAFEEQPSDADNSGEAPERGRASSPGSQGLGELVEGSGMEHVPVQPGHHSPNSHWLPLVETVDEGKLKLPQKSPSLLSRVLVSNFTKLLMLAPRPQSHLITALRRNLPQVAMEIMNDAIAVSHLDKKLLNVALVLASKYDFPGLVDILIKSGASVHFVLGTTEVSENRVRETALLTAVDCQKLSIVKALLAHDAWLDLYESYTNVVSLAIERKFDLTAEAILRTLLFANPRSGVDNDDNFMEIVEGKHELKGSTVLHQAIRSVHVHGSSNVIAAKILLEYGVDANGRGDRDVTPLMAACYIRDMGLIALLLDWGANINEQIFYRGLIRGPPPVTVARVPLLSIDNAVAAAMCSGRSLILRYLLAGGATADWKLLLKTYTNTLLQFLHEREGDRDGLWGIRKIFEDKCSAIGRAGSSNAA